MISLSLLAALSWWTVDPMSTIQRLPDAEPTDGLKNAPLRIVAAKDEYEPASFVLVSDRDERVQVTATEFTTERGVRFPAEDIDLKVVKVWYQNRNAWFSYFGDCGKKLVPELLLNDDELITVDEKTESNYAKIRDGGNRTHKRWINPPRQLDTYVSAIPWRKFETFPCMKENFRDAETLQPVKLEKGKYRQFFVTVHVRKNASPGIYKGGIRLAEGRSIPCEIEVLPFELPKPRAYGDQTKEFKVSSYNYMDYNNIMGRNGYDFEAARKLYDPILRNLIAHNQDMYIAPCGEFGEEERFTYEAFKRAGMRTDELMGFVSGGQNIALGVPDLALVKRRAAAATRVYGHRNIHFSYGDEPPPSWMIPARNILSAYQDWGFKTYIAGGDMCFHKAGHVYDWFNVAKRATDDVSPRLWNQVGNEDLAWYANQHVGAEDPALNRRQNGLAAYLSGYSALCNYAHHFGNWNDDSTGYREMVYAYGCGNGVVNTLQFEGFREGIDDIRYATVLVALAREAAQSGDRRTFQLGRRALQYLAGFDKFNGSLTACRYEMIRYIQELRAKLGHEAVLPTVATRKANEPEADISKELAEDLAKAKDATARSKVYVKYYLYEKAYDELVSAKLFREAGDFAWSEKLNRRDLAELNWRTVLNDPKSRPGDIAWAMLSMLPVDRTYALKFENAAFGKNRDSTNSFVRTVEGYFIQRNRFIPDERFDCAADLLRLACKGNRALGKPVPYMDWDYGLKSLLMKGDLKAAAKLAAEALAEPAAKDWKPEQRYKMALARLVGEGKEIPYELGRDSLPKPRLEALYSVASDIMRAGDEATVRKLEAYRQTLIKAAPTRRYTVAYSPKLLVGPEDWKAAAPKAEPMDRRYGGSTEMLVTDVANDRGGEKIPGWMPQNKDKEKLAVPTFAILADAWGLHFRYEVEDARAAEIAAGLIGGDDWEGYLAAGKNIAYSSIMAKSGLNPTLSIFTTSYDSPTYRNPDRSVRPEWSRVKTVFGEGNKVTTYISLSWELFALTLPKDGDVWDYENIRWARAGDNAWNGTESIHGRSTWGELVFKLPESARREILRRQIVAASVGYAKEKNAYNNGRLEFWNDPDQGDPAFYAARLKPIVDRLDAYLPLVKADMSDADVDKVAAEALKGWLTIRQTVGEERAKYLLYR